MSTPTDLHVPTASAEDFPVPLAAQFQSDPPILDRLRNDPSTVVLGCHPPEAWIDEFGAQRVRTCAIAEQSFTGMAVGAAMCGLRPVVDLVRSSFTFVAMDQIANQAAKLRYLSGGQATLPITIRALTRTELHLAAQHEQTVYSLFVQIPGLKVVVPGTTDDMAPMMAAALDDPNPVLFFESPRVAASPPGAEAGEPQLGRARRLRAGSDATIVAIGGMVPLALTAAERLAGDGVECEVLDPRTLSPLDTGRINESVRQTGRLVVVDEGSPAASAATEIITAACEDPTTFGALRGAPARVTGAAVPLPFNPDLENSLLPTPEAIVTAVRGAE